MFDPLLNRETVKHAFAVVQVAPGHQKYPRKHGTRRGPRTDFSGRSISARLPACLPRNTTAWLAGAAVEHFARPVRPLDFDGVHRLGRSQPEMGAGVVAAQIALAGVDPADPAAAADPHRDLRAVGVAAQRRIDGADEQPVAAIGDDVPVQAGRPRHRRHQQVEGAVAVHVAHRQPPRDPGRAAKRGVLRRNVAEMPGAVVGEELVALRILAPKGILSSLNRTAAAHDAAVDHGEVRGAVLVEVGQDGAEAGAVRQRVRQARRRGTVPEKAARPLLPQSITLPGEVCDEHVEQAVAVHVGHGRAHVAGARPMPS